MGLFSKSSKQINWKTLNSLEQLDEIQNSSFNKPQVIFKHSTTCSISRMAKNRMEDGSENLEVASDVWYLDLLSYRSVSNAIAEKWNVMHESPQVLVIKNGISIFDASHNMVLITEIEKNLL